MMASQLLLPSESTALAPSQPQPQPASGLGVSQTTAQKCEYVNRLDSVPEALRANMAQLLSLGFEDFDLNLTTLKQNCNDLERAVNAILSKA